MAQIPTFVLMQLCPRVEGVSQSSDFSSASGPALAASLGSVAAPLRQAAS